MGEALRLPWWLVSTPHREKPDGSRPSGNDDAHSENRIPSRHDASEHEHRSEEPRSTPHSGKQALDEERNPRGGAADHSAESNQEDIGREHRDRERVEVHRPLLVRVVHGAARELGEDDDGETDERGGHPREIRPAALLALHPALMTPMPLNRHRRKEAT